MPKFFKSIFGQVAITLLLGIALGVFFPEFATSLSRSGTLSSS